MSGELAAELVGKRNGPLAYLIQSEYIFLLTVALRCDAQSREGWCSTEEIAHSVGGKKPGTPASEPTVKRLRRSLKDKGLIEIVRPGSSSHGVKRATVYRITELEGITLGDTCTSAVQVSSNAVQVSSNARAGITQMTPQRPSQRPSTTSNYHPDSLRSSGASQPQAAASADDDESGIGSHIDKDQARKIAGRLIAELWPPDLDPETLAVALGISVKYLTSGDDDPTESEAILRDALECGCFGANVPHKLWEDIADAKYQRRPL
ncbi:MAG: hypothetical protein ACLP3C_30660 [Mycobacterium sp.]|uniref:hypothetical protein n=1 Tax=Mycobacterium sp. TaxID=1785 RepID=UPI003F98C71D